MIQESANLPVKLQLAKWPRLLGELTHSNQFLKIFSLSALAVVFCTIGLSCILATRPPVVLAFNQHGETIEPAEMPKAEDQIRAAVSRYLAVRYNWDSANVRQRLGEAEAFVLPVSLSAYRNAVSSVAKFSVDKIVAQKIFAEKPEIDLEKRKILILGDRVSAIQGLKAIGILRLELTFDYGPRTRLNPWGIYITKEHEQ